jgi:hypothetical protein
MAGNPSFTIRTECAAGTLRNASEDAVFGGRLLRLSVRLMSL